jgi:Flp pilus assembly protein TadD
MEPYLDLVTSQDLTEAAAISKQSKSLLLFSERFLRSGDHGKALAVSAIAADRTPTSKAHLMICAEALAALGAADRAEKFLRQAETLAPGDAGIQVRAAKIRGQTLPGSGGSGVAGFFKRAFGGR